MTIPLPDPRSAASPAEMLAEMRVEIDRIDAEMHALLMARSQVIDQLIAVKARQGGGSAFRPQREAEMMRRLVERHRGLLPLDTVEGIWRIIISTFTYVQANYAVHADAAAAPLALRDSARFHFGFTVPFVTHTSAGGVIDAVAGSTGDLGLLPVTGIAAPWWTALAAPAAPKIIARLPFVGRENHPAGLPLYVIAQPLAEAAARDVLLYAATGAATTNDCAARLRAVSASLIASAPLDEAPSLLVGAPGSLAPTRIAAALAADGAAFDLVPIGSHAAPFDVAPMPPAPWEAPEKP